MARNKKQSGVGSGVVQGVLYCRVSSDEQEREGFSLPSQLADTRRYAARQGWAIAGEYTDVMKGSRDDRPQYQAMLAEVRRLRGEGQDVTVVVKWLHRLGRKLLESVRCREEFKALGVPIHSIMEGGEVADLLANVMASVAQYEVEQLGERIREVNGHLRKNGWKVVGRIPWGYVWREPTAEERHQGAPAKVPALDPLGAPYVAEAFRRVAQGESLRSVARWAASLPEDARGGRALSCEVIRAALTAPVYLGMHEREDGTRYPGRWPALTDPTTWEKVQERIAGHRKLPHQASGRYLLTGMVFCPRCGARMGGRNRGYEGRKAVYVCIGKALGASAADPHCEQTAMVPLVDAAVRSQVVPVLAPLAGATSDPRFLAALRRAWQRLREPELAGDALARLRKREAERTRARKRLTDAALKLVDGDLDKPGYDLVKERIEKELAGAEADLAQLRAETGRAQPDLPPLGEALAAVGGWAGALAQADVPAQREVLSHLVERVVPERLGRGTYRAHITWTPLGLALRALAQSAVSADAAPEG